MVTARSRVAEEVRARLAMKAAKEELRRLMRGGRTLREAISHMVRSEVHRASKPQSQETRRKLAITSRRAWEERVMWEEHWARERERL